MSTKLKHLIITSLLFVFFTAPFYNIFSVDFVDGHDFILHFRLIYILEEMIKKGVILPRWLPEATYGYGTPVFTFMWGLPYYLGAFLHVVGFSYSQIFKILLLLPNIASGIGFYMWIRPKYGRMIAFVASSVWLISPYRFLDSFIRNAIGELFFFAFIPFVFLFLDKAFSKKEIILGSFFTALLIYSHQGLSLFAYSIFLGYILFGYLQDRDRSILKNQLFILLGGLLLTFFYWMPVLAYHHLLPIREGKIKSILFPPFWSLIRSKWEGGSVFDGKRLIMSFQIGLGQLGIISLSHLFFLYSAVRRKKHTSTFLLWLLLFWLSIFFMQPISKWFWVNIPLIINIQFPFRLLFIAMLVASVLTALILFYTKKPFRFLLGFLFILAVVVSNRNHLRVLNKEISLDEIVRYRGSFDVGGEKLPKYVNLAEIKSEIEQEGILSEFTIVDGEGEITDQKREAYLSVAKITMRDPGRIKIRRIYFPGWQVYLNGEKTNNFDKGNGIFVRLPQGKHEIKVAYKDSPIVVLSNIASVATFLALIVFLIKNLATSFNHIKINPR